MNSKGRSLERDLQKQTRLIAFAPMETPTYSRQAERCRRLARSVNDPDVRERLLELAAEYEAKAADETSKPGASD
jgi:hypothetical protein